MKRIVHCCALLTVGQQKCTQKSGNEYKKLTLIIVRCRFQTFGYPAPPITIMFIYQDYSTHCHCCLRYLSVYAILLYAFLPRILGAPKFQYTCTTCYIIRIDFICQYFYFCSCHPNSVAPESGTRSETANSARIFASQKLSR